MYNVLTRGEVTAFLPDMDKNSRQVMLPELPVRQALPPPSNEYRATVAPSLRYLYSVVEACSIEEWSLWDDEDRLDAMSQLTWANEWLKWYREESFKLRDEYADLLKRRNTSQ